MSARKVPVSFSTWMAQGLIVLVPLTLAAGLLLSLVLKKTMAELTGPYLAFSLPLAIFFALVWWLRRREVLGMSSDNLARAWGCGTALLAAAVTIAITYSGAKLGLIDPRNTLGGCVTALVIGIPVSYFACHHMATRTISARRRLK